MGETPRKLWRRWWLANSLAFIVGYLLFSPVAHWFSGPHGTEVNAAQFVMHSLGLLIVCVCVLVAQLVALRRRVSGARVAGGALLASAAFWIAWYAHFEDFLVSHAVLALAAWVRPRDLLGRRLLATLGVLFGVEVGTVAGAMLFVALAEGGVLPSEVHTSELAHALFWLFVGGGGGIVGGGLSAPAIAWRERLVQAARTRADAA